MDEVYVLIGWDGPHKVIHGVALTKEKADEWRKSTKVKTPSGWWSKYQSLTCVAVPVIR